MTDKCMLIGITSKTNEIEVSGRRNIRQLVQKKEKQRGYVVNV